VSVELHVLGVPEVGVVIARGWHAFDSTSKWKPTTSVSVPSETVIFAPVSPLCAAGWVAGSPLPRMPVLQPARRSGIRVFQSMV
jgi:hypothetical protein